MFVARPHPLIRPSSIKTFSTLTAAKSYAHQQAKSESDEVVIFEVEASDPPEAIAAIERGEGAVIFVAKAARTRQEVDEAILKGLAKTLGV